MRNSRQGQPDRILHPVPDLLLGQAAALWRAHFGGWFWPRRVDAAHGLVAVDAGGRVTGVMGLRDGVGGFGVGRPLWPGWLYRPAPPTADLVIDGLAVIAPRQGTGRALVAAARQAAARTGRPGLRAEVRARNRGALAFYKALGFVPEGCGRYGLPWWGQVHLLRLAVPPAGDDR
ncbi:GNAT family N-acetyltransferase [Paracoccus nototheniae]|uniref:GNAT family N-acetyltransferase n=2 Tax=Paracoccus nototheniae TaxID=2489002 RepID=A0ABW4DVQ4_9RHOB|nr:GNAT family N-acetyltransferase [Paracoccus nototheniae]